MAGISSYDVFIFLMLLDIRTSTHVPRLYIYTYVSYDVQCAYRLFLSSSDIISRLVGYFFTSIFGAVIQRSTIVCGYL